MPKILIVGAGPVGLTAALELARRGINCRIIDNNSPSPENESRALAVNKRTLDLLGPSGVAKDIVDEALVLRQMRVFSKNRPLATIRFSDYAAGDIVLHSLPQGRTERLLAARLAAFGITPEWGVSFTGLSESPDGRNAAVIYGQNGAQTIAADIIIGADGAHSSVRKSLGLSFAGESFPETFYISDINYDRDLPVDFGEARFFNPGVIARIPVSLRTFRYISTLENYRTLINHPAKIVALPWETTFKASFRHVQSMQKGNVFLAGDAAHIHSPVGGRGMNLGIEDACWLAWLISEGRQSEYTALRMDAVTLVLAQTKGNTRAILLKNPVLVWLRNLLVPLALRVPAVQRLILNGVQGIDTMPPPWLEQPR